MTGLIRGTAGDDTLLAGTGSETLDGGAGWDTVSFATAGAPVSATLYGDGYGGYASAADATLPGDYRLLEIEALVGSAFGDSLQAAADAVLFNGAGGDDTVIGGLGADTLIGGEGDDRLYGMGIGLDDAGSDSLDAGAGDDTLTGYAAERMTGGSGADRFVLALAPADVPRVTIADFDAAAGDRLAFSDPGAPNPPSIPDPPGHSTGVVINQPSFDVSTPYDPEGLLPGTHLPLLWLGAVAPTTALLPNLALVPSALLPVAIAITWVPDAAGGGWLVLDLDRDGQLGAADGVLRLDGVAAAGPTDFLAGALQPLQSGTAAADHLTVPILPYDPAAYDAEHGSPAPPPASHLLDGGAGDDTLEGGRGNDTLVGGAGHDWMAGGLGSDTYLVDGQGDVIFESGEGEPGVVTYDRDTAIAAASFQLYAHVEDLILADAAGDAFGVGNDLGNIITGNAGANLLLGLEGDDTLAGGGGADTLHGGEGDDVLFGEGGADLFLFDANLQGGGGRDLVADFAQGEDHIRVIGWSPAQLAYSLREQDGSSVLEFGGGNFVVVRGVTGLTAADFVFA